MHSAQSADAATGRMDARRNDAAMGAAQRAATALATNNPRLLPLVAHDRAGFGGALVAEGLAVLLIALWGYRPGARWLWWTFLASGVAFL